MLIIGREQEESVTILVNGTPCSIKVLDKGSKSSPVKLGFSGDRETFQIRRSELTTRGESNG